MNADMLADAITTIAQTAKDLGCEPSGSVVELTLAIAGLETSPERNQMNETKPLAPAFDGPRFLDALTAVREHRGIESDNRLAMAIGVNHACFARLRKGQGIEFESLLRIVSWSGLDIRRYLVASNGHA